MAKALFPNEQQAGARSPRKYELSQDDSKPDRSKVNNLAKTKTQTATQPEAEFSIRSRLLAALLVVSTLLLAGGGWAGTAKVSGAVIAQGTVVVERHVKKVQHLIGGIVAEINVVNGGTVQANAVLIRLDDTRDRAELGVVQSQIIDLVGRKARLLAERDGLTAIEFSPEFDTMGPGAIRVRNGEIRLFGRNREARESEISLLHFRIEQKEEEIRALASQRDANKKELQVFQQELGMFQELYIKELVPVTRLYALEREAIRIEGENRGLEAQSARALSQIGEINLEILAVNKTMKRDAQREIRDIEGRIAELTERKVAVVDRLSRVELRAPVSGVVHELAVHTVGGVVTAAEPVMLIVPVNDDLTIEVHVLPGDIDQVVISQQVRVRLSAFNQSVTSELRGKVIQVAADVTEDTRSGQNYYLARVEIDKVSLEEMDDWKLVPGMPVEVFMTTGERTVLSYLAKPITDQFVRSFRDQ